MRRIARWDPYIRHTLGGIRVMRCCSVLFLSVVAVLRLSAQQDAMPLIREVVTTLKGAKSYHFESVTESDLSGELHHTWSKGREVLAKDQADRVHFETIGETGSYVVVSDGKTLWRAAPDSREFIRTPLSGPLLDTKGGGPVAESSLQRLKFTMSYLEKLEENLSRAEQVRNETLEVDGKLIECVVVRAEYTAPKGSVGIESRTRTFWIDKQRKIVLREDSLTRGKLFPTRPFDDVESRHSKRYVAASVNEPVPAALFVYTPPRTFREVDKLERPFPRAARDLIGKPAPELSMQTLTGETLNLRELRGKIVLLDFWATWCEPCRKQMPSIAKLYRETREQGVFLLGVNDDETQEKALQFIKEQGYDWPNVHDAKQLNARSSYKVDAIPTVVVIDKEGIVAEYQIGDGEVVDTSIRTALRKLGIKLP
jgi:thiol-disulfide isomerase/thioredoxin/outer membrane lipoprotein-sorting protein